MTETSPVSCQTRTDDDLERRTATIGRVHPHVEIKVVDPVTGEVVRAWGDRRVLHPRLLRDARLLGGRRRRRPRRSTPTAGCTPATSRRCARTATAPSSAGSRTWSSAAARTSTRARSRSSSTSHPDIEDVQVIGVPDEKYGEELCAWVKMRAGADPPRRRGRPRLRDRQARPLQDPALRDGRRRVPDDRHRQDPQGPDARGVAAKLGLGLTCIVRSAPSEASDGAGRADARPSRPSSEQSRRSPPAPRTRRTSPTSPGPEPDRRPPAVTEDGGPAGSRRRWTRSRGHAAADVGDRPPRGVAGRRTEEHRRGVDGRLRRPEARRGSRRRSTSRPAGAGRGVGPEPAGARAQRGAGQWRRAGVRAERTAVAGQSGGAPAAWPPPPRCTPPQRRCR